MGSQRIRMWMPLLYVIFILGLADATQAQEKRTSVKVEAVTRAVSKTPVLIAYDKGFYRKYGLDVQFL